MVKKSVTLISVLSAVAGTLFAQQPTTNTGEGTLLMATKSYALKHAVAYETKIDDEDGIAVVLSGSAISSEKIKEMREAEKEDHEGDLKRPFLKLLFKKTGELKYWAAGAGESTLGRRSSPTPGELKLQGSRATGQASHPLETKGILPSGFDVHFDVALVKAGESLPASVATTRGPAANVKPTVTGTFKGNGKEAKLIYVSAHWREPFGDKPSIVLVFSEKDHSKDKKPDFNASFGKFGSALTISLHEDGSIFGCEVTHTAHKKQGFSSIGNIETNEFTYQDGKVEGELTTHGQVDTFGETWEVAIKFVAPLGEIPKEFQPAEATKPQEKEKSTAAKPDDDADEPAAQPAAAGPKAKDLALTKDASDVEYKALVGHIAFKSKSNVKAVCAELAAGLKGQGWTKDGSDLIQPQSSILKRKQGKAELTIFVKPEGGGSEVSIMTEGLSWK